MIFAFVASSVELDKRTYASDSYARLVERESTFRRLDSISLADSQKSEVEVYTTSVVIRLEERVIRIPLITLPYAKGNRTLL
ncbi:hypothetical protein NPIL_298131 [Nephila pilipes]|uniref:Uncharacterized protein n=1 Tax=Nephila pilipes TaxID=299642 RepID=A0A8X6KJW0_NEPPI|nr:hypothetical protein NPIL_298131 [Nephila pilipes]